MKTTDPYIKKFPMAFYADPNTSFIKPKKDDRGVNMNGIYFIPKTANEAIGRLESLKMYCEHEMESGETGSGIWAGDIAALEIAIKALEREVSLCKS